MAFSASFRSRHCKVWWCFCKSSELCSAGLIILSQLGWMTGAWMRYVKDLYCEQEHASHQSSLISSHRSSGSLAVCCFLAAAWFKTTWLKCVHAHGQRSQTSWSHNDKSACVLICLTISVKWLHPPTPTADPLEEVMVHNICVLLWLCTFLFLNKQNHQQVSMGIPGGASEDRIKANEIKPVIKAAGERKRKNRKKGKVSQTEQLGYHWKVDLSIKCSCKTNCTKQVIFFFLLHLDFWHR